MPKFKNHRKIFFIVLSIFLIALHSASAKSGEYYYGQAYRNIEYHLYVPSIASEKLNVLVSIHGTNGDAKHYLDIPIDAGDAEKYGLVIVAPQFQNSKYNRTNINGKVFDSYESESHLWLQELLEEELPRKLKKIILK